MSDKPSIADRPDDQLSPDPPTPDDVPGGDLGDEPPPYEPEGDEKHEATPRDSGQSGPVRTPRG